MEPITEYGVVQRSDVIQTLLGLAGGTYANVDLYSRYVSVAKANGHIPGEHRILGRHLRALGCLPRKVKRQRAWFI